MLRRVNTLSVELELTTMLLTPYDFRGLTEPALSDIGVSGGAVRVTLEPELLLKRTGYACMDESEFPPNSVDAENTFYDHECQAALEEDEVFNSNCHITSNRRKLYRGTRSCGG